MKPYNPDSPTLARCAAVWLSLPAGGDPVRFEVSQVRPHKRVFLLGLEGIDSLDALAPWLGSEVHVESSTLPAATGDEVYHFETIGLTVRTVDGERIGTVREVLALPGQDVWVVRSGDDPRAREILIPLVGEIVKEIDLDGRFAVIDPPLGLLEE